VILAAVLAAQIGSPTPAALGEPLWFVTESPEEGTISLCVVDISSDISEFTLLRALAGTPRAIAATGSTAWIAPAARDRDGETAFLLAIRAAWDAQLETWMPRPSAGMDRLPAVRVGDVDRLIASTQGPIVIGTGSGSRPVAALRRGTWQHMPELPVAGEVHAAVDVDGVLIALSESEGEVAIWRCEIEGGLWEETALRLEGQPRDLLALETGVLVGSQVGDSARLLGFLQGDSVVPWTKLDDVPADTTLLGSGSTLLLFRIRDGIPRMAFVDRATGLAGPWRAITPTSGMGTRGWSILTAVFIGVAVVFVLFFGRRAPPSRIPGGLSVAPLLRRVLAFGIDLVPGIVVVVLFMDVSIVDVLTAAVAGPIPSTGILLVVLAAVTAGWGVVWEGLGQRATPGKRAMRLITASTSAAPIRLWQILIRNLLRGLIVLAPPIAIIVLLTPTGQSLADVAAGTFVLIRSNEE
jgi:uncharacterized RDD family membrane protein YckC